MNLTINHDGINQNQWVTTFDAVNTIFKVAKFVLGLGGIIIAIPILLPGIGLLYFKLVRTNKKNKKLTQKIYNEIPNMTDKELIEYHLIYEQACRNLSKLVSRKFNHSNFYLYKPVMWQLHKCVKNLKSAKKVLKKAAYPEIQRQPSKDQIERLMKTYSDLQDWDNDDYDIYEKEYLN